MDDSVDFMETVFELDFKPSVKAAPLSVPEVLNAEVIELRSRELSPPTPRLLRSILSFNPVVKAPPLSVPEVPNAEVIEVRSNEDPRF